jgi:hypothetical protein
MGGGKNNLDEVGHGQVWLGSIRFGVAMFGSAWLGKGCNAAYRIFCEGSVRCLVGVGSVVHGAAWMGWVRLARVECVVVWYGWVWVCFGSV